MTTDQANAGQPSAAERSEIARLFDNEDLKVSLNDPVLVGASKASIVKIEKVTMGEQGDGVGVKLTFELAGAVQEADGTATQPGAKISTILRVKPPGSMQNAGDVKRIAIQDAAKIAQACGKLDPKIREPQARTVVEALDKCVGCALTLKLKISKDGQHQNLQYARA